MTYEEIIKEITSKLSGDNEKDTQFLLWEFRKYIDHEYANEILKAIGRLISDRETDSTREIIKREFNNLCILMRDVMLDEVRSKIKEGNLDKAERLLKNLPPVNWIVLTDKVSDYFSFNNLIEGMYYQVKYKPTKQMRQHPENHKFYQFYGYILVERKDYKKAIEMLDKGLTLNPLDTDLLFEKAVIFQQRKDWDTFKELTDRCIEYAYTPFALARACRNYGYMFTEKEDYEAAIACYIYSSYWQKDKKAENELYYISQKTKKVIDEEYYQRNLFKILEDRGVHIEPNREILPVIYSIAENLFQEDNLNESLYYYKILYDLMKDEDIFAKIQSIEGNIKGTA
jgi:tetratricopeptide (TPR) repeat protein